MVDAVLFELLHTEMVAELGAHDSDHDRGPGVSAGRGGEVGGRSRGARGRGGGGPGGTPAPPPPRWATWALAPSSVLRPLRGPRPAGLAGVLEDGAGQLGVQL